MTLLSVAFSVAIQFAISFAFALGGLALALRVAGVRSPRVRAAVWLLPFLKAAWDLAGVDLGCWALAQGFDLAHRAPGSLVLSVGLGLRDRAAPAGGP
ncbi:MAG: hypothetical protein HY303_13565 [Candidatus Wallbacteria bacterium]|nr:hypothetical protein [Candidatus Wallbacteria bacterium]